MKNKNPLLKSITHLSNELLGSLWKILGPPKVEILTLLALRERNITRSVLLSRNLLLNIEKVA